MKQKKQIIMLPSDKPGYLHLVDGYPRLLNSVVGKIRKGGQHLYVLSDEEIKNGDAHFNSKYGNEVRFATNRDVISQQGWRGEDYEVKKIIDTTDPELIKSGVSEIPTDIIEAYVKAYNEGKPFDEVMVEYDTACSAISDYIQRRPIDHTLYFIPKLNQDGTLAVSLIEEKMYSKEDVIKHSVELTKILISNSIEKSGKTPQELVDGYFKENL